MRRGDESGCLFIPTGPLWDLPKRPETDTGLRAGAEHRNTSPYLIFQTSSAADDNTPELLRGADLDGLGDNLGG
jgi:hypothetical protein